MTDTRKAAGRPSEAGFTLVEALVAMLVLAFGVAAVANLMLVGASSNTVGNASTAATTQASLEMERLKAVRYDLLAVGGDLDANTPGFFSEDTVPGVGLIRTRWTVQQTNDPQVRFITVRSQAEGALSGARSRAQFTVFRSCTSTTIGCP
jgi:Tfp pilus assembly protein PilV